MTAQKTPITITTEDLASVADAAKALGKHVATIYRWHDAGIIIGAKFGGILFIPVSEVERMKKVQELEESAPERARAGDRTS